MLDSHCEYQTPRFFAVATRVSYHRSGSAGGDGPRTPTPKSVPPRSRNRSESGRVREGQNSRIRRPSKSVYFSIQILFKIGRFWVRAGPGLISRVFGWSKTGRPEGHPDRPPRRSTTRSKSTRSSRLSSVSSSSVLFRSVLLRDVGRVSRSQFRAKP